MTDETLMFIKPLGVDGGFLATVDSDNDWRVLDHQLVYDLTNMTADEWEGELPQETSLFIGDVDCSSKAPWADAALIAWPDSKIIKLADRSSYLSSLPQPPLG